MFVVYKITNKINKMAYIGSSIRVEKRQKQHINSSKNKNNPRYNYPLYKAFREFGIDNFLFEIIADDFNSVQDMEEYEQQMIDYYNTLDPFGYNQTRCTHSNNILSENHQKYIKRISKKCAKVDINNNIIEIYSSYHDAARKNNKDGDNGASEVRQVCKGERSSCFNNLYFRDIDDNEQIIEKPFKNSHGKKTLVAINVNNPEEEKFFESISQAAIELATDRTSIQQCIQGSKRYSIVKGYILREIDLYGNIIENEILIEDRIKEYNKRNPIIDGIQHDIPTQCKIYNIKQATVNARIRNGQDSIKAITTPLRR